MKLIREIGRGLRGIFTALHGQVYWPPKAAARDLKQRLTVR